MFRGVCAKRDRCNYKHHVDAQGKPKPVGQAILQRYDEAVKRVAGRRAEESAKIVPTKGADLTSAMIVLEDSPDIPTVDCSFVNIHVLYMLCHGRRKL